MKSFYRISEAAALIGIGASALRSYTNQGLIECSFNPAGQRIYSIEQINTYLGAKSTGGRFYRLRGYQQQKKLLADAERTINEKQAN